MTNRKGVLGVVMLFLAAFAGCRSANKDDGAGASADPPAARKLGEYAVFEGYYDIAEAVVRTQDSGFLVAGTTRKKDLKYDDLWLLRLDSQGGLVWDKVVHQTGEDTVGAIVAAKDGGFVIAGATYGKGEGQADAWILKVNDQGDPVWDRTYGGKGIDRAYDLVAADDGGFVAAGFTESKGAGERDVWVLRLDNEGKLAWDKTFGGAGTDEAHAVALAGNGGYFVAGFNGSKNPANRDAWVLCLGRDGGLEWDRTFGAENTDMAKALLAAGDGGVVAGGSREGEGAVTDSWLARLDASGRTVWEKTFGGTGNDGIEALADASDGQFVAAGQHGVLNEETNAYEGMAWVARFDGQGSLVWETSDGSMNENFLSVVQAGDGGFAAAGLTFVKAKRHNDVYVIRTDAKGGMLWEKTFDE